MTRLWWKLRHTPASQFVVNSIGCLRSCGSLSERPIAMLWHLPQLYTTISAVSGAGEDWQRS